jgi:hypothetical protein
MTGGRWRSNDRLVRGMRMKRRPVGGIVRVNRRFAWAAGRLNRSGSGLRFSWREISRGPAAVAAVRPVVAAAWGTAAVSALPFSPRPSSALHGSCERERHEDRHGVGIVPDNFGEPGGWRDGLAIFGHAFDMHSERLSCSLERLVEAARGGNSTGEIWERDAVIRIGVFVDQGDVVLAHVLAVVGGDVTVIGDGQGAAKPVGAGPTLPRRAQPSPQGR